MIEPNSSSSTSSSDRTAPASPSDTVIDIPIIVTTSVDSMPHAGSKEKGDDQGLQVTIEVMDIEHFLVQDDPRLWSSRRKSLILFTIAFASMAGTIATAIFFPALPSLQSDLNASDQLTSVALSLFILFQGVAPMFWSAFSEIRGRRMPYITSMTIFCAGTIGCARAGTMTQFIILRVMQAIGSSSVLALGAGTLADIYDIHERGTKLGIYYALPLVGQSLGVLVGGLLSEASSWRATFYFLEGYGLLCLGSMIWLPETFRQERSLAWRSAMKRARAHALEHDLKHHPSPAISESDATTPTIFNTASSPRPTFLDPTFTRAEVQTRIGRVLSTLSLKGGDNDVQIHLRDVNPLAAIGSVLSSYNNVAATALSGMLFGCQYAISYTAVTTYGSSPYNYGPNNIGIILLAFGLGNIVGSIAGGKYSDIVLRRMKEANGGVGEPEMRIMSTRIAMVLLPPILILYAWLIQKEVMIAGPVIALFFLGIVVIWIYSSTLAYIVDSNPGRSSSAIAVNSLARGTTAAIASQICGPLVSTMGNGWFYTGFALVIAFLSVALLAVPWRKHRAERAAQRKGISLEENGS